MTQWQKIFIISMTIAIISLVFAYINRNDCYCPTNEKITQFDSPNNQPQADEDVSEWTIESEMEKHPQIFKDYLKTKPKYWFHHAKGPEYHYIFEIVETILNRLSFQKIEMEMTTFHYNWDILWSYQTHDVLQLPVDWSKLQVHQKINHIPGNHVLVSKSIFGTTTDSKYVPKAFIDVEKLKEYAAAHPEKKFVLKSKSNRGVRLEKVSEMNFKEHYLDDFAQEFIDNPLLFDGHKFDFAVYAVITSFQPLRTYYYTNNMLLRFCPKPYNISDPTDTDSYVVSDTKTPVWEFNGTKKYFDHGYSTKDAFEGFLKGIGVDVGKIWKNIEDCIRSVIMMKEKDFIHWTKVTGTTKHNHFELVRFDMILDANMDLHLIEVNQHPNLYPSANFIKNRFLYENLIFNLFNLIGVGTTYNKENLKIPSMDVEQMIADGHSLNVSPETCLSSLCENSCDGDCMFCRKCLSDDDIYDQLQAYREQMNLGHFKRVFPAEQEDAETIGLDLWGKVSKESVRHAQWFDEMCEKNRNFC
ncbi:probable tubulin polyglutamylase ttll-15 [Chironomus tepperi]|uniref:probable tubulin polyglutamylase ttll-15 n=1 Tax=Chironomus tepperi TaxID=113505 RepID=UPI00391F49C3